MRRAGGGTDQGRRVSEGVQIRLKRRAQIKELRVRKGYRSTLPGVGLGAPRAMAREAPRDRIWLDFCVFLESFFLMPKPLFLTHKNIYIYIYM